ncbi:hypothetical protein J2Z44_002730 [Clostridium punense]|uniref:Sensor histidine kinase n=1 Tax=Clostridium punense TaxID=1054297 RepID=A0ABS4K6K8_9CLOT|nr:hypothetical protein M918_15460 [Clostridium sp. BL8]MBP2022905.1 hypothetical protein [Clostridium punense]
MRKNLVLIVTNLFALTSTIILLVVYEKIIIQLKL